MSYFQRGCAFLLRLSALFWLLSGGGCRVEDEENLPPDEPQLIAPAQGSEDQPTRLRLQWSAADPDGDPLTYTLYLDTGIPPQTVYTVTRRNWVDVEGLEYDRTYYWTVKVEDDRGGKTQGPVWRFKTGKGELLYSGRITLPEDYYFASEAFYPTRNGKFFVDLNLQQWAGDYDLEVFLMSESEFQRYRQGPDFGVLWRANLPYRNHYQLLTGLVTSGSYYRLVIDNTDDGWASTDFDGIDDTAEIDLKIYFREYY